MDNDKNGGALSSNAMMDAVKMLAMLAQAGSQLNNNVQAGAQLQLNTNNVASPASSVEGQIVRRVLPAKSSKASASKGKRSSKPWDSEDEEDENNVIVHKKPAQSRAAAKCNPKRKMCDQSQQETVACSIRKENTRIINLPDKFEGYCAVNRGHSRKECHSCHIYIGVVMVKPCGHAAFCFNCINKLRDLSFSRKKLQKCPVRLCNASVTVQGRLFFTPYWKD